MDGDVTVNTESNGDIHHQTPGNEAISIEMPSSNGVDNDGYSTDYIVDTVPSKNGTAVNGHKNNQNSAR